VKPARAPRVSIAMRNLGTSPARVVALAVTLLGALAVGCGGPQRAPAGGGGGDELAGSGASTGAVRDTRTEIERRRDAACDALAPRITACAVEDARKDLASGKVTQQQFSQDTSEGVQRKNSEEFAKACKARTYSSRQVRVLEICPTAEQACDAMLSCLDNLNHP